MLIQKGKASKPASVDLVRVAAKAENSRDDTDILRQSLMYLNIPEKRYRQLRTAGDGAHGSVRHLVKDGEPVSGNQVEEIRHGHERAFQLRQASSNAERAVADGLASMGFRHSYPECGYYLDFYHAELHLDIEIDGHHHQEPKRIAHDKRRDSTLRAHGIRVWRFNAGWALGSPATLLYYIRKQIEKSFGANVSQPRKKTA